jgi:hypothetical protein
MPGRYDRDRHDRPSWRELDRKRDRSAHRRDDERREPRSPRAREVSQAAKQAYVKKLDEKLFGGKASSADREAEAVRAARGTRDFSAVCDVYVERNGFPEAPALLLLFLDHESPDVVLRAIASLTAQAREKRVDRDALVKALRRVKTMTDDADVEAAAEELLDSL